MKWDLTKDPFFKKHEVWGVTLGDRSRIAKTDALREEPGCWGHTVEYVSLRELPRVSHTFKHSHVLLPRMVTCHLT